MSGGVKLVANPPTPTPWPNWKAPVSTRKTRPTMRERAAGWDGAEQWPWADRPIPKRSKPSDSDRECCDVPIHIEGRKYNDPRAVNRSLSGVGVAAQPLTTTVARSYMFLRGPCACAVCEVVRACGAAWWRWRGGDPTRVLWRWRRLLPTGGICG